MSEGGHVGKILRIELTRGKISEETISGEYVEKFIGGPGIAAKILYDEVHPWIESLAVK